MFSSSKSSKVKGTKKLINRNQILISLGLPSLDSVIGGGLPVGNIILVEEDEFGIFSDVVLKHYLAEGVLNDHTLLLGSLDVDCEKLVTELPSPLHCDANTRVDESQSDGHLRIAWRYENLSLNPTADVFGNTYDLSSPLRSSTIAKAEIKRWKEEESCEKYVDNYDSLYHYIKTVLEDGKYNFNAPSENRTVLRIALISLGSGSWTGNICTFLIKLRFLLRNSCATCFVSIQPTLFENMKSVSRCEHLCDTVIQLKSLLNEGNKIYEDYDGLLVLKKLPSVNNWTPIIPETNDWAFKLKKKRFIVEKLHISPELKENDQRGDEEDISSKILSGVSQQF